MSNLNIIKMKITYNELIEILVRIGFKTIETKGTNVFLQCGKFNFIITLPVEKRNNIYDSIHLNELMKLLEDHQIISKEKFVELVEAMLVKV
jgi:hypothetical protein